LAGAATAAKKLGSSPRTLLTVASAARIVCPAMGRRARRCAPSFPSRWMTGTSASSVTLRSATITCSVPPIVVDSLDCSCVSCRTAVRARAAEATVAPRNAGVI